MKFAVGELGGALRESPLTGRHARRSAALLLAVAAGLASAGADGGDGAVRVELAGDGPLPFSSAQLLAAVEARLPLTRAPDATATAVRISAGSGAGRVLVSAPFAQLEVLVGGKDAPEAARLVALAVVDVTRAPPPAPELVAATPPPATTTPAPATATATVSAAARATRAGPPFAVALYPGVSTGLGGSVVSFEPTVDLSLTLGRAAKAPWRIGLSAGYARTSAAWNNQDFTLSTLPLRLGPRWRWRWLELGAGAAARLYDTAGLDGGRGALLGAYASLGAAGPLAGRFQWTAAAVCDGYREKVVFRAAGEPVLTTGPFVFWLGVGARWGGGAS
ncbi:MAG TPA: hypothetical protein VNO55_25680 [Polyangia bacterium]|nr:hypothetical protein [Polyangia bacterium]